MKEQLLEDNPFTEHLLKKQLISIQDLELFRRDITILNLSNDFILIINEYLLFDILNKNIENGWSHPTTLQALSEIRGIHLFIWQVRDGYLERSPRICSISSCLRRFK